MTSKSQKKIVLSTPADVCTPKLEKITKKMQNGEMCAIFVINLGQKQNRLATTTFQEFHDLFTEIEETPGPKACVITGTGKFFSNGLDLEAVKTAPFQTLSEMHLFLNHLLTLSVPTVAAINGHAFAGGAMIALACDYRIMTTGPGLFCLNEVDIGLVFTPGTIACVRAKVDRSIWAEMILGGKRYNAQKLFDLNIINKATEANKVMENAMELAISKARLGENTYVYGSTKKQLYFSEVNMLNDGFGLATPNLLALNSKM